jgi:hypothetical protein
MHRLAPVQAVKEEPVPLQVRENRRHDVPVPAANVLVNHFSQPGSTAGTSEHHHHSKAIIILSAAKNL